MRWFLVCALIAGGCAARNERATNGSAAPFPHAAVAAGHELASQAGLEILRDHQGNAVDAAVASAFALSVLRPYACGIGGGGFMVIHFKDDPRFGTRTVALNYRETAPAAVSGPDYFLRLERELGRKEAATRGATSVGVPGTVAGLLHALEHYGTLDRKTVMAPAIRLAEEGFIVNDEYIRQSAQAMEPYPNDPARQRRFTFVWQRMMGGGAIKAGDRLKLPEQSEALRLIAEHGTSAFYEGPIAQAILDAVRSDGGAAHLTADDLRGYRVDVVKPVRFTALDYAFITMPPPSSGGVGVAQGFGILERLGHDLPTTRNAERVHLEVEAMKHAFADRAAFMADPRFADVPVQRLMSDAYLRELAARVDRDRTLANNRYGTLDVPRGARDDAGTCHLSVVDAHGNAVACTETLFTGFGSNLAVAKYGFALNNTLGGFTRAGGEANVMNLIQADGNLPGPGKRPLASMTPTIVLDRKTGRVELVAGASGGPRIISATFQAIDAALRDDLSATDAVARPRFHHQWQPDELLLEPGLMSDAPLADSLRRRGHTLRGVTGIAKVQLIRRHPSGRGWEAACDPREGGVAAGY